MNTSFQSEDICRRAMQTVPANKRSAESSSDPRSLYRNARGLGTTAQLRPCDHYQNATENSLPLNCCCDPGMQAGFEPAIARGRILAFQPHRGSSVLT